MPPRCGSSQLPVYATYSGAMYSVEGHCICLSNVQGDLCLQTRLVSEGHSAAELGTFVRSCRTYCKCVGSEVHVR